MKKAKKLVLAKETVRNLERSAFGQVAGGDTGVGCGGWPFGTNNSTCTFYNSCQRYCLEEPIGP